MNEIVAFFHLILITPITNVLVVIYHFLAIAHIPFALGFSIILLTVLIRLILWPLTASQLRASKKMQDIAPHVSRLKDVHKGDAKRLQQETMKLYKEHGVNPLAGCLPALLQLPLIWALYSVLQNIVKADVNGINAINKVLYSSSYAIQKTWDTSFFGLPLGESPSHLIGQVGFVVLLVPVLTGVFQYVQSKMLFPGSPSKEKKSDDFASAFQSQSTYIFPFMIGFFSYSFPIGLSLYWNTFTIFGIIQQYIILGPTSLMVLKGNFNKYGRKNNK
jgi:YidC/Oxa1 family membrane protein insertase